MAARILLDANVLMELFFSRLHKAKAEKVIAGLPDDIRLATSILSTDILFYYVESGGFGKPVAYSFVSAFEILDINGADFEWAYANDQGDFEDALQTACALRHKCQKIVTLDRAFAARHSKHISVTYIK